MPDDRQEPDSATQTQGEEPEGTKLYDGDSGDPSPTQSSREPAVEPASSAPSGDQGSTRGIAPGTVISNRFVLDRLLGQGGMSLVFRARDLYAEEFKDQNPYVAVKILRRDFSGTPDAAIALQRETRKMQKLAHPHIATVYSFGIDREMELYYIWMEELQGHSLTEIIKKSPTGLADRERAISIILSIADGLEYAHKRGIVHSDLKPSNVFLTEKGEVKILDFGIARAIPGSDTDTFDAGSLGALTPGYATREMFDGEPPDPADDIYALGLIANELLTGKHPYSSTLQYDEPAKVAEKLELKPEKIKGLNRRQWHTVSSSMAFERATRPRDAGMFLRQFRRRSNTPLYLVAALSVVLAVLVYEWLTPDVPKPEIPFEQLPVATRDAFHRAMAEGDTALKFGEVNGALHFYNEAFKLHQHNPEAVAGLEKIVKAVKAQDHSGGRRQQEAKLKAVQILLSYDVFAERADLRALESKLQLMLAQ